RCCCTGGLTSYFPHHHFAPAREEMVRCLHWEEAEKLAALVQCGQLIQGMNQQLQEHLCKIRELKAIYGRLQAENRKLRNLCYFLDEDQLKAKCLASHWQIFGHHMAQVLRYEVASCLCKLAGLEGLLTPLSPLHHSGATNGVNLRGRTPLPAPLPLSAPLRHPTAPQGAVPPTLGTTAVGYCKINSFSFLFFSWRTCPLSMLRMKG
uniref:Coiled-coil domain containing 85B n=1 Tax=Pseudonaja textilis TaxID=8673 RepID=A0A670Z370_PSETE